MPAGTTGGGQWTKDGDGGATVASDDSTGADSASPPPVRLASLETGTTTDGSGASSNVSETDGGAVLAGDTVSPRGFTIDPAPPNDRLDPQKLNTPISADEQQRVADALTKIVNGDTTTLQPHPYQNLPHFETGAVLPSSALGYRAYDVPGVGGGRGEGRLLVDNGTGAIYYTNTHYRSFYPVQINRPWE